MNLSRSDCDLSMVEGVVGKLRKELCKCQDRLLETRSDAAMARASDVSTAGKCPDDAVNSQAVSSNATQSECLTQDSFVNSYTDNAASPEMKEKVISDTFREDDSDMRASALSAKSNVVVS